MEANWKNVDTNCARQREMAWLRTAPAMDKSQFDETGFIYNIIAGTVLFIDYEYADFNYAIFDLANHFCEFAGVDNPDYTKCPNEEEMRSFLCLYLQARHGSVDEGRLQNLLRRMSLFQAVVCSSLMVCVVNSTISKLNPRLRLYQLCVDSIPAVSEMYAELQKPSVVLVPASDFLGALRDVESNRSRKTTKSEHQQTSMPHEGHGTHTVVSVECENFRGIR
ncbi:hypothetical protein Y032_1088g3583 [Ancylostoma ceylanicum]|uniref:ethanolamine kinase n=1 Tax=Ancylostoma ceylanicum TaxID=53326 RepID=A0A016W609_9BILA|nr:hypothetical protein Y032_1088g3583 [Ancylostoma ceylanicum]